MHTPPDKIRPPLRARALLASAAMLLVLQACSSNDDDEPTTETGDPASMEPGMNTGTGDTPTGGNTGEPAAPGPAAYTLSMVNLTSGQPLSPPVAVLHDGQYRVFETGQPASMALETLAEGGDASALQAEAEGAAGVAMSLLGDAPIGPGGTGVYDLADDAGMDRHFISLATMLVNTNDAFTGVNTVDVSSLTVGQSLQVMGVAYDSGTEVNSEGNGTLPGPANGAEGFNAVRDDRIDAVTMHSGVVSQADGLESSVLGDVHRFLNPVVQITITRTE